MVSSNEPTASQGHSRDKDVVTASKQISAGGSPSERQAIGLLPEITSQAEVTIVGNAAGRGAVLALLNEELRAEIELAAHHGHLLEQAEDPDFGMEFALQTSFPKRQK